MAEKLKIVGDGKWFEIIGNREGLIGLAIMCLRLAMLPEDDDEAQKLGNHYHYNPSMNNAEEGSLEMTILYKPDL